MIIIKTRNITGKDFSNFQFSQLIPKLVEDNFYNVFSFDDLSLWVIHTPNISCGVTIRCMVGWVKPQATQMWGKYIINGVSKKYHLEFKSTFLLCSSLGFTNISLRCITLLSEGGDQVANTPINRYWGAIQIRKGRCNTQYMQLNKKEEINISTYIKGLW